MKVVYKTDISGYGLYSTQPYNEGDIIFVIDGYTTTYPTRESIYIGNGLHVHDPYGQFMNHSFTPTTRINGRDVIALVAIPPDTELTFDYNVSEMKMACPFQVNGQWVTGNDK